MTGDPPGDVGTVAGAARVTGAASAASARPVTASGGFAASASAERTQLSWVRSGLSVVVVATLLVKHAVSAGGGWTGVVVGLAVLGAGVVVATVPVGRYLRSDGEPTHSRAAIRATAAICTGIGLLALVVLLVPMRG